MKKNLLFFGLTFLYLSNSFATSEGLTREQIQSTLQKKLGSVMKCYEDELKSNPQLKGRVVLSFDVELDGKIVQSTIKKTTLNNQKVENCIVEQSKTWVFPKPTGTKSVHVDYPYELSRKQK